MTNDFNPTFQVPPIGYRGPTSSRAQNEAWQSILFDQQRMIEVMEALKQRQADYAHIFAMEQEGLRQELQRAQARPVSPETIDPVYGKRMAVRFSNTTRLLQHTGAVMGDHRLVTLPAISKTSKLTTASLGGNLFFPTNALQVQYLDQDGNVLEPEASWRIEETDWRLALDGDPRTFFFRRVSVPADSPVAGLGMRLIASIDDSLQHRSCNLLEVIPFPEYLAQVKQITMLTGRWGGIPLATDPQKANLERRPLYAQAGYRDNYHQAGDSALSACRQIYAFPAQEVVSVEIDLWQAQGVVEGDRRVFTLGCNHLFLGLASYANSATFRLNLPRPVEGWTRLTKLDPILTVDGQPPFSLPSLLDTRLGYRRPDGLLGYAAFGEAIPDPEELTLDITLSMDTLLKAPPLLYGFDLYYRP